MSINLIEKAKTLPSGPGCYLMKDRDGEVIYVGKAKKLKSRVKSYFDKSQKTVKTQFLVKNIKDFDFILCESDAESFILENNLIKKHSPKYNIRLKDDKSYPYIVVDTNEPFPRLKYLRRPTKVKGRKFFGPFPMGHQISHVARILTKSFTLRDCSLSEFKRRTKPCLLYQMKQCSAPCVEYISESDYEKDLKYATDFLNKGRGAKRAIKYLEMQMLKSSEKEDFERAAILRDNIEILSSFYEQNVSQSVEFADLDKDVDVIAFYQGDEEVDISIYMVRGGLLLGHKNFYFSNSDLIENVESEVMTYLLQYYSKTSEKPPTVICCDFAQENEESFQKALIKTIEQKVKFTKPRGKFSKLFDTTAKNAQETQRVRLTNNDSIYVALSKLQSLLKLKERPRTIECYDVAIWQGKSPTASQVVFHDGVADKKSYRYYHLEERPEGNNDFAMMSELVTRRLKKGQLPDVFLIDGGVAQVNTVKKVLEQNSIELPVIGIAKARDLTKGNFSNKESKKSDERLIIPGRANPYILSKTFSLFKLCVYMRDEAHRFSRRLHHKAEKKRLISSWIDEIPGIGSKTKKKILEHLGNSKEELIGLDVEDLVARFEITHKQATNMKDYLDSN